MTRRIEELLAPSDVARMLSVSVDTVRALADSGKLPVLKTPGGRRLFLRKDVERIAEQRKLSQRAPGGARK